MVRLYVMTTNEHTYQNSLWDDVDLKEYQCNWVCVYDKVCMCVDTCTCLNKLIHFSGRGESNNTDI